MKLQRFGFFAEMPRSDATQLLAALKSDQSQPNEERILSYLRGGVKLLLILGLARDLLDKEEPAIGPPDVFTDGTWLWTADVIYCVEKYHVRMPKTFISRMEEQGWRCPVVESAAEIVRDNFST